MVHRMVFAIVVVLVCLLDVAHAASPVPATQQKFLDDFCANVNCESSVVHNGFTNWNFTKNSQGDYLVDPCAVASPWLYLTCGANVIASFVYVNNPAWVLKGSIPATIGSMTSMTSMQITGQELKGPLPSNFQSLTNLQTLDLSQNRLTGTLPANVAQMTSLTSLNLNTNSIAGTIPTGITTLTTLTLLGLEENMLTGTIPTNINALTGLTKITLGQNKLVGSIPANLYSMSNLTEVDLDHNMLTGSISAAVNGLTNVQNLELNDNMFSGGIPSTIWGMTKLTNLYLGHNLLTGAISGNVGDLTNLLMLQLGSNSFVGQIPTTIDKLTKLQVFDVAENQLVGSLPRTFNSTSLVQVELGSNSFSGPIPDEILIKSLVKLTLEDNALTGVVPQSISVMTSLQYLYLDHNSFTGKIPYQMNSMSNLKTLSLYQNSFSGPFALCKLVESLTSVNIVDNNFNCWSHCWRGESALVYDDGSTLTQPIPNCLVCPVAQYSMTYNMNATNAAAGTETQCATCETGKFSYAIGAQTEKTCQPCMHVSLPFSEVNFQCVGAHSLSENVYVGGYIFNVVAFLFSLVIGLFGFGIFGYFVHKARTSSTFVVKLSLVSVLVKMSFYGFVVLSEMTIALALIGSVEWLKFGAIILLFRCFHVLISGYVLISAYDITPAAIVNEAEADHIPIAKYATLMDSETLFDPANTGVYNLLSFLCLLESQFLQLLPWLYSRTSAANFGYPDGSTYTMLNGFKFLQQCVTMIVMMTFLGDSGNGDHGEGLTAIFALNIMANMGMILYTYFAEPLCCSPTDVVAEEASPEQVKAEEGQAKSHKGKERQSVFVEAGSVYSNNNEEESGVRHVNPMVNPGAPELPKKAPAPPSKTVSPPPAAPGPQKKSVVKETEKKEKKVKKYTPPGTAGAIAAQPTPPAPPAGGAPQPPPPK